MARINKLKDLKREYIQGNGKLSEEEFTTHINNNSNTNEFIITTKEHVCCADKKNCGSVLLRHIYYIRVKKYNRKHYIGCKMTFLDMGNKTQYLGSDNYDGFNIPHIKGVINGVYEVKTLFLSRKKEIIFTGMSGEDFNIKELKKQFKYELEY